ncbi:unnamed protein product, partial [marine sediment metagenome]
SNDAKQDERWDSRIAETIQYKTRNVLCLPIKSGTDVSVFLN